MDALYLADSQETAWAEWYRHLAERAIPPLAQMPREMWTWDVNVEVADLSTDERLAAVGLNPPQPNRGEWLTYQRVGEQIAAEGWAGLLTRSAAHPDGNVLCLFRRDGDIRGAIPLSPPRLIAEPPPPPQGLRT
jgi:RES domain-containing protein